MTSLSYSDKAAMDRVVQIVRERAAESSDIVHWARFVRDECGVSPTPFALFQILKAAFDLPLPDGHWIIRWAGGSVDDQMLRNNVSLPSGSE